MDNLEQSYEKIEINSFNLDTIFGFCPDGIVYKDKNLSYVYANKSYIKTFSLDNFGLIVGKKINPYISENIRKLIYDADIEVVKSYSPINYVITLDDKTLLNIITFPLLQGKKNLGLISIIKDITQEEAIKEDFVNKHFEYINAEKNLQKQRETFVASLGHDLKNPTIAQIRGLELLLKGEFGNINSEQRELLEMVLDSCKYMNGMLSSLLATYRNYEGKIKLKFEEFSFSDLVQECISEMLYVAKDKGVNISLNNINKIDITQADRIQIKRVIMNLLSNGIKYAFKETELIINIFMDNSEICFEFLNNSPYIPEDKQKTIFAQYVSYATLHKELGIGLGLYASQKIIEGHNGNIYVNSFKDNKNIFGFKIPIKQADYFCKEICF